MTVDFKKSTAKQVLRLIGKADSPKTPEREQATTDRFDTFVRITGALDGAYYPCVPCRFSIPDSAWIEFAPCWAKPANSEPLREDRRYRAICCGQDGDRLVFETGELVPAGCGLEYVTEEGDDYGKLRIKASDLAGDGLSVTDGSCPKLKVDLDYSKTVNFVETFCPVWQWLKIEEGSLTSSDTDNGGIKVMAGATLQRKQLEVEAGAEITDLTCTTAGDNCCPSSWWCTGEAGGWTVVEIDYGGTPPAGGYGPYATEEAATAACIEPEGDPVSVACCEGVTLPRTLTVTTPVGSYLMVYSSAFGTGGWISYPPTGFSDYPGYVPVGVDAFGNVGYTRISMNPDNCLPQANWDGNVCYGWETRNCSVTCEPFVSTCEIRFQATGNMGPCYPCCPPFPSDSDHGGDGYTGEWVTITITE